MRLLLSSLGTQLRLSCPYTSQQNGKAERVLRTVNDCVRTLLIHSAAPLEFWAEALATATHLINRRPCRATGTTTPYELLFGTPPSYDALRVFGCRCFPNTIATSSHKLAARSTPCIFIGYPADHRGYRCYEIATGRIITSRHVVFDEACFPFRATASPRDVPAQVDNDPPPTPRDAQGAAHAASRPWTPPPSPPPMVHHPPRRSTRGRIAPQQSPSPIIDDAAPSTPSTTNPVVSSSNTSSTAGDRATTPTTLGASSPPHDSSRPDTR